MTQLRLLAPKDAARVLGVSTTRVQQFDREGHLKALRDSAGRRLFLEADVLRFKTKREKKTSKPLGIP